MFFIFSSHFTPGSAKALREQASNIKDIPAKKGKKRKSRKSIFFKTNVKHKFLSKSAKYDEKWNERIKLHQLNTILEYIFLIRQEGQEDQEAPLQEIQEGRRRPWGRGFNLKTKFH